MCFEHYRTRWLLLGLLTCIGCSDGEQSTSQPQQPNAEVIEIGNPQAAGGTTSGGGSSFQTGDPQPVVDPATGLVNAPSLNHGTLPVIEPITLPTEEPPQAAIPAAP